jgi:hypothetical protein
MISGAMMEVHRPDVSDSSTFGVKGRKEPPRSWYTVGIASA